MLIPGLVSVTFRKHKPARIVAEVQAAVCTGGRQAVRDLWRQRDLGRFVGQFKATVPRHSAFLLHPQTG